MNISGFPEKFPERVRDWSTSFNMNTTGKHQVKQRTVRATGFPLILFEKRVQNENNEAVTN